VFERRPVIAKISKLAKTAKKIISPIRILRCSRRATRGQSRAKARQRRPCDRRGLALTDLVPALAPGFTWRASS
jgi:hypothetical protein